MPLPTPHPDVVVRTLPDGAVLFHPGTEVYFGLNESGTLIWETLSEGAVEFEQVVEAVAARWPEVPRPALEQDVRSLLAELLSQGLVTGAPVPG